VERYPKACIAGGPGLYTPLSPSPQSWPDSLVANENRSRLRSTCTPHECGSCKKCIIFSCDDDRWKDPLARAGATFSGAGIHDLPEQRTVEPVRQLIPRRDTDGLMLLIWNPRHHVNLVSNQSNPDNGPGAGMDICHAKDLEQFRCPLGARLER